jgi:tetratricopeptide (TPR) repeat protein
MTTLALVVILAAPDAAAAIPWERDHRAAFTAAEERRAPLLVHFRSDHCERTSPGLAGGVSGTEARGAVIGAAPRSGAARDRSTRDEASDCDRMEELVWSNREVAEAAARYVPVLTGDTSDRTLTRRYEAATMPTTLLADPWGNEIVRALHFVDAPRLARILRALPADFAPLEPVGRALRERPHDPALLAQAAAFYERARLFEIAERYYERAAAADGARKDHARRRRMALARGTNLLRIGKAAEAARVFRETFEDAPGGAQGDAVLFGWMMAELQQKRLKEAQRPYRELLARFPESRYAARAKENMSAVQ